MMPRPGNAPSIRNASATLSVILAAVATMPMISVLRTASLNVGSFADVDEVLEPDERARLGDRGVGQAVPDAEHQREPDQRQDVDDGRQHQQVAGDIWACEGGAPASAGPPHHVRVSP